MTHIGIHNLQFFDKNLIKDYKSDDFLRCMTINCPSRPYKPRTKNDLKTTMHWGQRKLLMTEIEFLTQYSKKDDLVLYVGAAPAIHTSFLSKLFPTLKFILVDPMKFNIKETDKIEIRKEYFTDEKAREFINKDFLFICDIRISNDQINYKPSENEVKNDMIVQQRWVDIMKPRYSILKFRLPWNEEQFLYLDGKIVIQPWGPQSSTETRLIVNDSLKKRKWNCKLYEEQMYYFNTVTRCKCYNHNIVTAGIDHCYDCSSEIHIIENYLNTVKRENIEDKDVTNMIHQISKHLTKGEGSLLGYYYYKYLHWNNSHYNHNQKKTIKSNLLNLIYNLNTLPNYVPRKNFYLIFKEIKNILLNTESNSE